MVTGGVYRKFGCVIFEIREQTDGHTDLHTGPVIAILRTPSALPRDVCTV